MWDCANGSRPVPRIPAFFNTPGQRSRTHQPRVLPRLPRHLLHRLFRTMSGRRRDHRHQRSPDRKRRPLHRLRRLRGRVSSPAPGDRDYGTLILNTEPLFSNVLHCSSMRQKQPSATPIATRLSWFWKKHSQKIGTVTCFGHLQLEIGNRPYLIEVLLFECFK